MKPLAWHPEAKAEARRAAAYYKGQRKHLDREFREELEAGLVRIQRNPSAFSFYEDGPVRKCLLQRFPYTIFFEEFDKAISVWAVSHQKQRPGYWLGRTAD